MQLGLLPSTQGVYLGLTPGRWQLALRLKGGGVDQSTYLQVERK